MATSSAQASFDFEAWAEQISSQFRDLNMNEPGQWPLLPKLVAGLFAAVVVVVIGWFLVVLPVTDELAAEEAREVELKEQYRGKLAQAINLDELRKQKLQVQEYVTQLERQLPGKAEMDALLSDINQAGLVDVGQQGVHLGLARQLALQLGDVLLHLQLLLAQLVEVDGLRQLAAVLLLEFDLASLLGCEFIGDRQDHQEPADHHHHHRGEQPGHQLGQQRPLPGFVHVQVAELRTDLFGPRFEVEAGLGGRGCHLCSFRCRRLPPQHPKPMWPARKRHLRPPSPPHPAGVAASAAPKSRTAAWSLGPPAEPGRP